ncbi:MAG TPA: dihydroneopterin aldolase [Candidatus Baltobacteraceae bacterium]|nr:dihydroneopterin aldolase [Candidatus Baltobacteraceae bacterium]
MDVITLSGVRAYGRHGANPGERDAEQAFEIDVRVEMDLTGASFSDDLGDTLNYAELHERVVGIVQSTSFALLERLAAEIANAVFRDPRVVRAEICIAKPQLLDGATPGVCLRRENPRCARR